MSLKTSLTLPAGTARRRLLIGLAIVAAFTAGLLLRGGGDAPASGPGQEPTVAAATTWTCSMHPQIKLPKPGQCPICFMDLIPLQTGADDDPGPRSIVLTESAVALAEIQTVAVQARHLTAPVRLIGKVAYDETLFRTISAWVSGRIDNVFVDFTGTKVDKGDRLVSLYSPEMYATQVELLNAIRAERSLSQSADPLMRDTAAATVVSARERLKLWGLTREQIERVEQSGQATDHVDVTAPVGGVVVHKAAVEGMYVQTGTRLYTVADLSRVWVTLNAYESDLAWLREGDPIDFTVEALPGRAFTGRIVFIDPVLDSRTRTVPVRINVDNRDGALKPGMFVNATAQAEVGAGSAADGALVIPATAPMITGERAVVYVRVPAAARPTFEGREVVLGARLGDHYIVKSGLMAGEMVVTRGNFKIDSALQILAKPSMMSPAAAGPLPAAARHDAPAGFQAQIGKLLASYLEVQTALAGDNDVEARSAAGRSRDALAAVDMGLLTGKAHQAWMADAARLEKSLTALATAGDIAARRQALRPATGALWSALRRFGYEPREPVRLFHCPMANNNAGADWLQLPRETANPYFGSAMLRCGSQTDSLAIVSPGQGR